jgi:uncharacterized protein
MLSVNLRHLEEHEIRLQGELSAAELDFAVQDPMIRTRFPLHYDLKVQMLSDGLLVTGALRMDLDCDCVRCLKPFRHELRIAHWTRHFPFAGEEQLAVDNDCVDLTPFVREDILLEFPRHPLCKPECRGLENTSSGPARTSERRGDSVASPWAELNKLKL